MSVRQRTWVNKDGETQTAYVADYFDSDGKRQRPQFEKKRDADRAERRAKVEIEDGVHTPDSATCTVGVAAPLLLQRAAREGLEETTIAGYEEHVRLHICPEKGGFLVNGKPFAVLKLSRLTKQHGENFRDHLLDHNTRITAQKIFASFFRILKEAKRLNLVGRNVAEDISIKLDPRHKPKVTAGVQFPTREEVQRLLALTADLLHALLVTAIFTGMRISELRGLLWDDVDFDKRNPIIRVRRRANARNKIGPTKTRASQRDLPMPAILVDTLLAWREICPRLDGKLWLVFPNRKGKVADYSALRRQLNSAEIAAGVVGPMFGEDDQPMIGKDGEPVIGPKYGFHGFRHFFASVIIEQKFSVKRVQEMMGHSDIKTTFDTYVHLFPWSADDEARLAAGAAWVMGGADVSGTKSD
jgi:integrase